MKLKNQFLILCGLIASTALFIVSAHAFDGFYAGGSVGGILSPVNHLGEKVTDIIITGSGMKINESWNTARKPSMNFTLNGGFGRLFDKHYCGVEGSINKMRYRMNISKTSENSDLRIKDNINLNLRDVYFAIDYKQGYLVSPKTLVYAKTGIMRTRARMTLHNESIIKFLGQEFTHPSYLKNEKIIHPVRIGFGVEHKLSDVIALTCNYTYTRYLRSFKLKGQTQSSSPMGHVTSQQNHKMVIQDTSVMLGLKSYF